MADDIQAQVRAGIEAQIGRLMEQGLSPQEIRALVPKLQEEVNKQLTPFGPPAPTPEQAHRMQLDAIDQKNREFRQKYGEYEKPTGIESVFRAVTGGLTSGAFLGFASPERRLEEAGHALLRARRMGASDASIRQSMEDFNIAKAELEAMQDHPIVAGVGTLFGGSRGPGATVGSAVTKNLPSNVSTLTRVAAGGVAGGAVEGAGRAALGLRPAGEIAQEGLEGGAAGAVGAVAGYGAGKVLEGVGKLSRKVREYVRADKAGTYDTDDMVRLPPGEDGMRRAAEVGRDKVLTRDDEIAAQAKNAYGAAVDPRRSQVVPPEARAKAAAEIDRVIGNSTAGSGEALPGADGYVDRLQGVKRFILGQRDPETLATPGSRSPIAPEPLASIGTLARPVRESPRISGGGVNATGGVSVGRPGPGIIRGGGLSADQQAVTDRMLDDYLKLRSELGERAGFGSASPTGEQIDNRRLYGAVRSAVRTASPEVAAADDAFTAYKSQQARRNDILFRSEDGGRPAMSPAALSDDAAAVVGVPSARKAMRVGDEVRAATTLGRVGDDSTEARNIAPYLEELANMDPKFREALDFIVAKKALEATKFRLLPSQPTNLNKAVSLGGLANTGIQNARAIGRTAYDAGSALSANAGGATAGSYALKNPVLEAYEASEKRKQTEQRELSEKVKARRGRKD